MDRVVLVTGAGSGVGKEVALALADAGHRVGVAGTDAAAVESAVVEITEVGGDAAAIAIDAGAADPLTAAVALIEERLGPVEVLVLADPGLDPQRVADAVVPGLRERRRGRVVVVSDPGRTVTAGGVTVDAVPAAAAVEATVRLAADVPEVADSV